MHASRRKFHRGTAAAVLGAVLAGVALVATADEPRESPRHGMGHPPSAEEMKQHLHRHLDKLAARLEIKASQQGAWNAYTQSIEGMPPPSFAKPSPDLDAAALTRQHAERAAAMAQRLATVAEATANLEQALDPDQRKTLDQAVREHSMPKGGRHHHHHRDMPRFGDHRDRAEGGPDHEGPHDRMADNGQDD